LRLWGISDEAKTATSVHAIKMIRGRSACIPGGINPFCLFRTQTKLTIATANRIWDAAMDTRTIEVHPAKVRKLTNSGLLCKEDGMYLDAVWRSNIGGRHPSSQKLAAKLLGFPDLPFKGELQLHTVSPPFSHAPGFLRAVRKPLDR
jgi:hypothetical protein